MGLWTTAERDQIKAAVASGVLTVTFDGPPRRSVTYQSLDAMRALLASMETDLARQTGRSSILLVGTRKGFASMDEGG